MPGHSVRPVTVSGAVPAAPDVVFEFVADTRNDPKWCQNVDQVDMVAGNTIAPGSRFRFHQHLDRPRGGRIEFDVEVEIVALEARSITWRTNDRFQVREITITVAPSPGGSTATQTTKAVFHKPPGVTGLVYPYLAKRTLKHQFKDLAAHFAATG